MDSSVHFTFKNRECDAYYFLSFEKEPYFIFLTLQSIDLIKYFGEEITIKTDLEKVLPKTDDYKALVELREAMFDAIKNTAAFLLHKALIKKHRDNNRH